jgi:UDP-3-O-[3-hydroxymyristoyl] glucosamine N-acyltransferase
VAAHSVQEIAAFLSGKLEGEVNADFEFLSKIDQSFENSLTFLANPKYEAFLNTTDANVILVSHVQAGKPGAGKTFIRVEDPYLAFCKVLNAFFNPAKHKTGIHPSAVVEESATLGKNVYIGANAYIGSDVSILDNTKIYPNTYIGDSVQVGSDTIVYANVSVYYECELGNNVIVHSGSVIGSDGFGHAPQKDGTYIKIPQIGNVIIEDWVEIGANCTIDRATLGSTIIRSGVKLDNLIQIAHNVEVGKNTVMASQSGISGSTVLGEQCVIGGQVGFAGHLKIAKGTQIAAQSGLMKSVTNEDTQLFGSPVMPLKDAFRTQVVYRKLPDLQDRVNKLEKQIKENKEGK